MNLRSTAIANGKVTYSSGKPCRAGHHSERYSSNGGCIECLRIQAQAHSGTVRAARIKRNSALALNLREQKFMVRQCDHDTMQELSEILQYSTPDVVANVKGFIRAIYESCPTPRILTRADLLKFIDFKDGEVRNLDQLSLADATDDCPKLCIIHNGCRYAGEEIMECVRETRLNVKPYLPPRKGIT